MKKIVIIGPESTGKSTLCQQLAAYYQTLWVPEFAREYLLALRKQYTFEDLLIIAKGQIALEDSFITGMNKQISSKESSAGRTPGAINTGQTEETSHSPVILSTAKDTTHYSHLFIDTDMYVLKVWCEFVFNKCHRWVLEQIVERKYDLYLLCNIDLPWTPDELREYPDIDARKRLFRMYLDILINQSIPWVIISGSDEQRFNHALKVVSDV